MWINTWVDILLEVTVVEPATLVELAFYWSFYFFRKSILGVLGEIVLKSYSTTQLDENAKNSRDQYLDHVIITQYTILKYRAFCHSLI